jgi:heme/copper-type cytochrome/quinol oxidase subunit 3
VRSRPVSDLSGLPTYGFGSRMTTWWGTLGFCALEGTGFALAAAMYVYLLFLNPVWPLSASPPDLLWSSLLTALLVLSCWPNAVVKRKSKEQDLKGVRIGLIAMSVVGVLAVVLRLLEFGTLHVRWDQNAYGSLVWLLLGLHTTHIVTDVADTLVVTALMFTRHGRGKRFADLEDNAFYWYFVVLFWIPMYALVYWVPRL